MEQFRWALVVPTVNRSFCVKSITEEQGPGPLWSKQPSADTYSDILTINETIVPVTSLMVFNDTVIRPRAIQGCGTLQGLSFKVRNERGQRPSGNAGRKPPCFAVNEASHEEQRRETSVPLPPSVTTCQNVSQLVRGGPPIFDL
ncbi:hypothetical protein AAFF_G00077190 [Aldrovandia affinis]|uniref:Uncharacterized protein n=1 Tax=Aldrovandia affinis TaxID=143900 RepID=A0AAD7WDA1_9TELE|nr:hypothetical protein AAFF_G00077190 [Aldrovandia affinis]